MKEPGNVAQSYINQASVFRLKGDFHKALELTEEALKIVLEIGDLGIQSACYTSFGNIYWGQYRHIEAIDNHKKALEIDEELGNIADQSKSLLNLGLIHQEMGQYKEATKNLERALKLARRLDLKSVEGSCLMGIGMCCKEKHKREKALNYYFQARKVFEETGERHYLEAVDRHINELS